MLLKLKLFPTGTHTDSAGVTRDFPAEMLQGAADAYDVAVHEAPIVELHDDAPGAFRHGYVAKLAFEDGTLVPYASNLSTMLLSGLNDKSVRYFSASFYLPENPNNPVPGSLYLRHVGIVPIPAVKGQPEPELVYSEQNQTLVVNFMEAEAVADDKTKQTKPHAELVEARASTGSASDFAEQQAAIAAERAALEAEKQAHRAEKIASFCESLEADGKLLPRDRDTVAGILDYLEQAPKNAVVNFGEGDSAKQTGLAQAFRAFLKAQPKAVEFGELSKPDGHTDFAEDELKTIAAGIAAGGK
jgi:hypothetical protein